MSHTECQRHVALLPFSLIYLIRPISGFGAVSFPRVGGLQEKVILEERGPWAGNRPRQA